MLLLKHVNRLVRKKYFLYYIVSVLIILVFFVFEFCFGFIEFFIGEYLEKSNLHRNKVGLIWEIDYKNKMANKIIQKLINDTFSIKHGELIFIDMLFNSVKNKGLIISKNDFINFYNNLSKQSSNNILSPYLVIKIFTNRYWEYTYFEKKNNITTIYFLDQNKNILFNNIISKNIIFSNFVKKPIYHGSLSELKNFSKNIYSAKNFFSSLVILPKQIQKEIIHDPEKLITTNNKILRVGISNKSKLNKIEIGIEISTTKGLFVIFFNGKEKSVTLLNSILTN